MTLTEFKKKEAAGEPHYLLFGHPVEHSWSPLMHNTALEYCGLDARYHAVDLRDNELTELASFLNRDAFLGANITIPYKQIIVNYLDDIDRTAEQIGAVNTIQKQETVLKGYNTDYDGFQAPLEEFEFAIEGHGAIVFGTGGASRAIVVALLDLGVAPIYLVSRSPDRITSFRTFSQVQIVSYQNWTSFADESQLIVNATPLGMSPKTNQSPVRDSEVHWLADCICYDIVYNPLQTKFLQQAEEAGATTIGGLEMLIQQAGRSFELWTGQSFPTNIVRDQLYEELEN